MPQPKAAQAVPAQGDAARIIVGPDKERFYCPHPGCNRSFAELWRLKVHYRAPPDVRGSGKERGHGTELKWCPKCGKDLKPGKHHVGCSAGKSAPRQAAKRQRQMSTTTESEWVSSELSDSLEAAVKRQTTRRQQLQSEASTMGGGSGSGTQQQQQSQHHHHQQQQQAMQRADSCRLERIRQGADPGELLFTQAGPHQGGVADFGLLVHGMAIKREHGGADLTVRAMGSGTEPAMITAAPLAPAAFAHYGGAHAEAGHDAVPSSAFGAHAGAGGQQAQQGPGDVGDFMDFLRAPSPMLGGPLLAGLLEDHEHDADELLRVPSPPPLPPDWDPSARAGILFDFDLFDPVKRVAQQQAAAQAAAAQQQHHHHQQQQSLQPMPSVSAPMVTITAAMSPQEVTNPSDDYIWQILFAGENDVVPKRVTAHLHHPPDFFDDDPLLDSLLGAELAPHPVAQHKSAAQPAQPAAAAQHGVPPLLDSIDAVLANLHPTPLDDIAGMQLQQQLLHHNLHGHQQPTATAATGTEGGHSGGSGSGAGSGSISPGGSGPNQLPSGGVSGANGLHPGEPVQQVPQVQSSPHNGFTPGQNHVVQRPSQPTGGKAKPEQAVASPARLQPAVEVGVGPESFSGFM